MHDVRPTTHPPRRYRARSRGANLALLAGLGAMIIGLMGVSIYTGLQAFFQNELQRITNNAAMSGAAAYYSATGPSGKPTPNPAQARQIASSAFSTAVAEGSLRGFNPQIVNLSSNDATDSITMTSEGTFQTPFLSVVGIDAVRVQSTATARALKYEPTQFTGELEILPDISRPASYNQVIDLTFPLIDNPGTDLYIEQPADDQRGYVVEACNNRECYDLMAGAQPVGTSQIRPVGGTPVLYGTATFDLARARVHKANKLRFTHANVYDSYNRGVLQPPALLPSPTRISRVMIFGYAGMCAGPQSCPIPAGFMPVE